MRYKLLISIFLIFSIPFLGASVELLQKENVHLVMDEIFRQHLNKKEMTPKILKHSFKTYIDQFDSERIYLLDSEVNSFTENTERSMAVILRNYKQNNYAKFEELNNLLQKSIMRARNIRSKILRYPKSLFQISKNDPKPYDPAIDDQKRPFVNNLRELEERIKDNLVQFINDERIRFGDEAVDDNYNKTLEAILSSITHFENQYLFVNQSGQTLNMQERENLFVIHILKALAKSLDSHTKFFDQNEAYDMRMRLEKGFKGIGIVLKKKPQGIYIIRLIKGGPAEKSGIVEVNDRIASINGVDVERDSLEDLMDKLRDDKGDSVSLVLLRETEKGGNRKEFRVPITLTREFMAIEEGRVDSSYEQSGNGIIAKVTLHSFYQGSNGITSEKDLRKAIGELKAKGPLLGLIIDLRENTGGFLNQAVKVAGLFITNGIVVISKYSSGEERFYRDVDGKTLFDGPIIILTSKATASAAEIVAGALQDWGVAIVVGDEQTYGKGTIQSQTITDGPGISQLKITVGKYYTVSGKTPQMKGVKADIVAPSYYSNELIGEEFLESALASDKIAPYFKDKLSDIEPGLKPWYIRYYMPTLQKRENDWQSFLPILKQKSKVRLANNKEYEEFTQGNFILDEDENIPLEQDLQLQEAYSILKDMLILEKMSRTRNVVGID